MVNLKWGGGPIVKLQYNSSRGEKQPVFKPKRFTHNLMSEFKQKQLHTELLQSPCTHSTLHMKCKPKLYTSTTL